MYREFCFSSEERGHLGTDRAGSSLLLHDRAGVTRLAGGHAEECAQRQSTER